MGVYVSFPVSRFVHHKLHFSIVVLLNISLQHLLSEVVEHHDVCIHVENVVAVGWVVICSPLFRLGAPERKHVITVFGLVVDTVKA